ncbi:MAG: DUF1223 domain-containing protein [Rhodospirillales bacterium]
MRTPLALIGLPLCLALLMPGQARADKTSPPVVVELFTAQGCDACPETTPYLESLAGREDVLALGFHVPIWDYKGWRDRFADAAFLVRQKAYGHHFGLRYVYTPQMVIQGTAHAAATMPDDVDRAIQAQTESVRPVLSVDIATGRVQLDRAAERDLVLYGVTYRPETTTDIDNGWGPGRVLRDINVVESWSKLADWPAGAERIEVNPERLVAGKGLKAALVLQRPEVGAIVTALKLEP